MVKADNPPQTHQADVFDLDEVSPASGRCRSVPINNLEWALYWPTACHRTSSTRVLEHRRAGVDRAFAKLDTIKDQVVWWTAGRAAAAAAGRR